MSRTSMPERSRKAVLRWWRIPRRHPRRWAPLLWVLPVVGGTAGIVAVAVTVPPAGWPRAVLIWAATSAWFLLVSWAVAARIAVGFRYRPTWPVARRWLVGLPLAVATAGLLAASPAWIGPIVVAVVVEGVLGIVVAVLRVRDRKRRETVYGVRLRDPWASARAKRRGLDRG